MLQFRLPLQQPQTPSLPARVPTTCSAELASRPLHLPPPTQTVIAVTVWEVEMADLFYNVVCLRTLSVPNIVRLVCRVDHIGPSSRNISPNQWNAPIWDCTLLYYLITPWSRVLLEKLVKKFPAFSEPEGSSPYPQAPATCPYPEPTLSSP
jgi:hypothetical protein